MPETIYSPQLSLNNNLLEIEASSFKANTGLAPLEIEATNNGTLVASVDLKQQVVEGTFNILCTDRMTKIIKDAQRNFLRNVLVAQYPNGLVEVYSSFGITNKPDMRQDGTTRYTPVEFKSELVD